MAEVSHRERSEARDAGEPVISCNCCRIRKLRCSRELPTCQQCRKTGAWEELGGKGLKKKGKKRKSTEEQRTQYGISLIV